MDIEMDIQGRRGRPLELSRSKQSLRAKLRRTFECLVRARPGQTGHLGGHLERKSDRRTSCDGGNLCVSVRYEEPPSSGLRIINVSVSLLLLGGLTLPFLPPSTPWPGYSEDDPTQSPVVLFQPGLKRNMISYNTHSLSPGPSVHSSGELITFCGEGLEKINNSDFEFILR